MSASTSAEDKKLAELLGDDAAVLLTNMPGADAFREAIKQLTEETNKGLVDQAKAIVKEAVALKRQVDAEERAHQQKIGKIRKALGNVIKKMVRVSSGQPADDPKGEDGKGSDEKGEGNGEG